MFAFRHLSLHSRCLLLLALFTSLCGGFANAGLVALINQALGASSTTLAGLGLRFLLLAVLVLAMRSVSQTLFMHLGQRTKAQLRLQTIDQIRRARYERLEQHGANRGLSILTQDLDSLVVFFVNLPIISMQGAIVVGCLSYLCYLSPQIFVAAVVAITLGAAGFRLIHRRAVFHWRASRRREEDLIGHFRALFDGAKELKLNGDRSSAFVRDTIAPNIERVRVQRTRGYVLAGVASSWGSLVLFAFVGVTLFVIGRHIHVPAHVMSGYALVFLYMITPIEGLLSALPNVTAARIAMERIEQLQEDLPPEMAAPPAPSSSPFQSIALRGITHEYRREQDNAVFTLGPIDMSVQAGELVFLIGGNGSGKTTLAKILVGLYRPEGGQILLNGTVIDEAQLTSYRHQFSAVFSDFYLFDDLLGVGTANHADHRDIDTQASCRPQNREIADLLDALKLSHKVRIVDGRFSTVNLSQGQRKRLALLVAYLEDRPCYVFDEWAADQDPEFKEIFYRRLLPALRARGKAVIVITHDDRYFSLADRCIKLDYGQIVAQGPGASWQHA